MPDKWIITKLKWFWHFKTSTSFHLKFCRINIFLSRSQCCFSLSSLSLLVLFSHCILKPYYFSSAINRIESSYLLLLLFFLMIFFHCWFVRCTETHCCAFHFTIIWWKITCELQRVRRKTMRSSLNTVFNISSSFMYWLRFMMMLIAIIFVLQCFGDVETCRHVKNVEPSLYFNTQHKQKKIDKLEKVDARCRERDLGVCDPGNSSLPFFLSIGIKQASIFALRAF